MLKLSLATLGLCALFALFPGTAVTRQAPTAQAAAQPPTQQAPTPPIRVNTRLVEVNVIVQDKKGNPVTDLTKDDFTILDGNKPQAISDFSMQATHLTSAPAQPASTNIFTNRLEDRGGVPSSVTVVLFDAMNTHFRDLAFARTAMLKFIGEMRPEDRVAIFGLATDLIVIQDFTSDQQALINAVRKSTTPENEHAEATDVQPSDTGDESLDEYLDEMNQMQSDFYNRDRAQRTADALTAIANYIGRLPGRKNLIWVSSAFPIEINLDVSAPPIGGAGSGGVQNSKAAAGGSGSASGQGGSSGGRSSSGSASPGAPPMQPAPPIYQPEQDIFEAQVEAAAEALDNANIAVYPVDARGLMPLSTMDASRRGSATYRAIRRGQPPPTGLPPQANFDTMNMIADRTGGRAYYNTNDITGSVRKAIDDSRVTYALAYYPDHAQWDGKFREIKVKVDRPDVDVRYRRGYFAVADAAPAPTKRHFLLQNALDSRVDSTTIGMAVKAALSGAPGAQTINVRIQADSQTIVLAPQGDHWTASLDFLVAQWDDKNKLLNVDTPTFEVRVTQGDLAAWQKSGFDVQFHTAIMPGASRIRFAGCDEQSGATGSVTIPIKMLAADSR